MTTQFLLHKLPFNQGKYTNQKKNEEEKAQDVLEWAKRKLAKGKIKPKH